MTPLDDAALARLQSAAMWPTLPGDRYTDLERIGHGGMGTVYRGWDRVLQRAVAIKVSNAAIPGADDGLDARLTDEARVLAALEHPGIVAIHDAGVLDDGRAFYVMRLVTGPTLATHRATLSDVSAGLSLIERIAETIAFAHAHGIAHRDLSPNNIMIGAFGDVLVLDWGVAHRAAANRDGIRVGTPGFMAPELASGAPSGPAAEVYSLGALLAWLLDGFTIDRRLQAIVTRCQAEAPSARYATVDLLIRDLAAYRAGTAITAYRDTWFEQVGQWARRYQTFLWLVAAYLVMRAALLWYLRR